MTMKAQVYRTNSSSYQDRSFFQKEKELLESIPGITYIKSLTEIQPEIPFILITNTHTQPQELPSTLLEKTVLLVHPNSGHDNFSKEFVQSAKFPVVLGNPIRSNPVAEYILSCIFHHFTPIKPHAYWSEDRKWDRKLLRDQRVLLFGMGLIGKMVFQSLSPLCQEIVVVDPYAEGNFNHAQIKRELSDDILKDKTIVIVCASLTESSKAMIDQNFLKKISPEALIVNAARGEIIQEQELSAWLRKNENARAYLDVFQEEPFRPGHMSDVRNASKTSHIAGVHANLGDDIIEYERRIIQDFCDFTDKNDLDGFKNKHKDLLLTEDSINFH